MNTAASQASVLIVPACERGQGGGHLSRSLLLLRSLQAKGRDAYIWIPGYLKDDFIHRFQDFFEMFDPGGGQLLSREEELFDHNWEYIVLDHFRTSRDEFDYWAALTGRTLIAFSERTIQGRCLLIGIDEGGPCRSRFDFLIDILPSLAKSKANISAPRLLPLPRKRRPPFELSGSSEKQTIRVLISFGTEDTACLGFAAASYLARGAAAKSGTANVPEITLIAPVPPHDFSVDKQLFSGVTVLGKIPNLREHLAEYDLFITHFGLGAFEAVFARLPVLLVSPGAYHEKLGRNAGFFSLGVGTWGASRLERLGLDGEFIKNLSLRGGEIASRYGLEKDQSESEDLGAFICGLAPHSPSCCPVCEKKDDASAVLARFPKESYRRCPACGTVYLARLEPPPIEYGPGYFFSAYKKQYGKTYLEDFPNLVEIGRKRLVHIKSLLKLSSEDKTSSGVRGLSLLDIGCAYGPFLAAAAECGFSPHGIEPAEVAARYVKEELKFPVWNGFFPAALQSQALSGETKPPPGGFDVISLWYVIEHFTEPGKMLAEIHRLLKPGGVLALSTPSYKGISGRKSLIPFLENSPPDHFTIWEPRSCKKIFRQHGFRLRKIVVTGHHPERFPFFGRFADTAGKGLLFRLLLCVSRFFRLGDTFEAYGVKS